MRVSSDARAIGSALVPPVTGHRQVTGALLLAVSRRHGVPLVTFDAALARLGAPGEIELPRA